MLIQKDKTEIKLDEPKDEVALETSTNVRDLTGLFRTVDTVPTATPRNIFEQIVLYKSGSTFRLYVYDTINNSWEKLTNTTLQESNSQVELEGDVILGDGGGITLTRTDQTIVITNDNP